MDKVTLLPCPFCGGDGDIESQPSYSQAANTYERHRVWCNECGFGLDWHGHESDAIAAWNTRATPAPDSEKLREALKLGADQLLAIKQANDPDDADSYRSDDREGCLDFTFAAADEAEKALRAALGASA